MSTPSISLWRRTSAWENNTHSRICWLRLSGQHSSHWSLMGDAQGKVPHAGKAAKHIQNKNLAAFLFDWAQQVPELKWDTCGPQQQKSLELVKAELLEDCFVPSWKHQFLLLLLHLNLHLSVQLLNRMFPIGLWTFRSTTEQCRALPWDSVQPHWDTPSPEQLLARICAMTRMSKVFSFLIYKALFLKYFAIFRESIRP